MTGSEAQVTKCMSRSTNYINVCVIVRKAETCLPTPVPLFMWTTKMDLITSCLHAKTMQKNYQENKQEARWMCICNIWNSDTLFCLQYIGQCFTQAFAQTRENQYSICTSTKRKRRRKLILWMQYIYIYIYKKYNIKLVLLLVVASMAYCSLLK